MATLQVIIDAARARLGAAQFSRAARQVEQSAGRAAGSAAALNRGVRGLGTSFGAATRTIGPLIGGFAAFSAVRSATSAIAGFEEQLATLRGVTGIPSELDERFQALTETARELGATTRFTAREAADGLTFLARAGFRAEEAIDAIGSTLDLAAVGGIELGQAADFASNIVSQFGLAAAETERVVDALVNTANSANTDVRQLAEALKFAGPIAGTLGNSVEETSAAIGVLGDRGIQASLAGTNLRGVLSALLDPTEGAEDALNALGTSLSELDPSTRSIVEIFDEFARVNLDAGTAVEVFGRRNAAAALILTESTERVRDLTAATRENAGTASEQAEIINDTLAGSFRTLRSAIEDLFLTTGEEGLAGALRDVTETLTGAVRIIAGAPPDVGELNDAAEVFAATMRGVAVALAAVTTIKIATFLGGVAASIASVTATVTSLTAALLANPLFAVGAAGFAIGFSATTAALEAFAGEAEEATDVVERQSRALVDLRTSLEGVADAQRRFAEAEDEGRGAAEEGVSAIAAQIQAFRDLQSEIEAATRAGQRFEVPEEIDFTLRGTPAIPEIPEEQRVQEIRVLIEEQSGRQALEFFDRLTRETDELEEVLDTVRERFEEQQRAAEEAAKAREREIENAARIREETDAIEESIAALELEARVQEESATFRERARLSAELLGKTFGELTFDQQELVSSLEDLNRKLDENAEAQEELARREGLERSLEGIIQGLEDEVNLLGLTRQGREELLAVRRLEAEVEKAGFELAETNLQSEIARVRELVQDKQALIEAEETRLEIQREEARQQEELQRLREASTARLERFNQALAEEREFIGLTAEEAAVRNAELVAEAELREQVRLGILSQQEAEETLQQVREDAEEIERLRNIQDLAQDLGRSVTDAFGAFITGQATADEALQALIRRMGEAVIQALVLEPLLASITGSVPSAGGGGGSGLAGLLAGILGRGGVISGPNVVPFQRGGVFGGPTISALSGGRTALLGEAGPEAALPLARLSSGELGVKSDGGGGGRTLVQNINISTPDAESFRRSERQLRSRLQRAALGNLPGEPL